MAQITLGGKPCNTVGSLPKTGTKAPSFSLMDQSLAHYSSNQMKGKKVILNIFPSVETGTCSASARRFNAEAASLENTIVACISKDLPFAMKRFCAAEGIDNVLMLSDYRDGSFGRDYGLTLTDGGFEGLLSRVVIILDEDGNVTYTEQVSEIGQEPNYEAALASLQ